MIISINTEKAFERIQHPFTIKTLNKLGIEENFLNLIKSIYEKPTANLILNGKRQDACSLSLGTRLECLLLPFLFNTILESSSPRN